MSNVQIRGLMKAHKENRRAANEHVNSTICAVVHIVEFLVSKH